MVQGVSGGGDRACLKFALTGAFQRAKLQPTDFIGFFVLINVGERGE